MFPRSLFQGKVLGSFFFGKEKRLKFVYNRRRRERERLLINDMEY